MIIDAHQHFWRIGLPHCDWPTPDLAAIHRDFDPADLLAVARPVGVRGCIAVQSQPNDADTDWLLSVAADERFVLGVVGWADLAATHAGTRIADLAQRPGLVGLRPMLQSLADDAWITSPEIAPALDAVEACDLALDALVHARHLPHLLEVCDRRPGLRVVIDHGAKPPLATGSIDGWKAAIAPFADLPHVHCKLSGLLTEAAPDQAEADFRSVVDHLMAVFGPDRLMWGSDWPVLNLAADYDGWLMQAQRWTELADKDRDAVFGGNALRFYGLNADVARS